MATRLSPVENEPLGGTREITSEQLAGGLRRQVERPVGCSSKGSPRFRERARQMLQRDEARRNHMDLCPGSNKPCNQKRRYVCEVPRKHQGRGRLRSRAPKGTVRCHPKTDLELLAVA